MKKTFKKMAGAYIKRRHRYGFGVHSPFAFMVVNDIIRCHNRYYASRNLNLLCREAGTELSRDARLLFRLVARFSPKQVMLQCPKEGLMRKVVGLADSRASVGGITPDVTKDTLVYCSQDADVSVLVRMASTDGCIIFATHLQPGQAETLREGIKSGVIFYDSSIVMAFSRHGTHKVEYSCHF